LDSPLLPEHLTKLVELGFTEATHFTQAGLLYAISPELILTGPFGSSRLQVKCLVKDCEQKLNGFEELLRQLG
jgi:hypothetical protein